MKSLVELSKKIGIPLEKSLQPNEVLFFSGAGISVPPPANFPLGNELHRMLLEYAEKFNKNDAENLSSILVFEETVSRLSKLYEYLNGMNIFLHIFSNVFEVRADEDPISITSHLLNHKSNDYHKYFNWHIKNGGKHFTVNIDQFIEIIGNIQFKVKTKENIEELFMNKIIFSDSSGYLLKIHGDVNKDEWGTQGYLYKNVQAFSQSFSDFLDKEINSVKIVIFIGYGGVDHYDITPYFKPKYNGYFQNTSAIWLKYEGNEELKIVEPKGSQSEILSKFKTHYVIKTTKPENLLNSLFQSSPKIMNTEMDKQMNGKEIERYLQCAFNNPKIQSRV
jgi:hypothetical protein